MAFKNITPNLDKIRYLDGLIDIYKSEVSAEGWNKLESMYLYPYKRKYSFGYQKISNSMGLWHMVHLKINKLNLMRI